MIIQSHFKAETLMYTTLASSNIFCAGVNLARQKGISADNQDKTSLRSLFLNHPYVIKSIFICQLNVVCLYFLI